jgi:hypothetical protein
MKVIILILIIFPSCLFAQSGKGLFSCSISSDKKIYRQGEIPKILVGITNDSNATVYLVKVSDGSELKWRYPYAYFEIFKIGDTAFKPKFYGRCGNVDDITTASFFEVQPHAIFNPYKIDFTDRPDNIYSYDFRMYDSGNFSAPGKYLIRFYYSTNETNFKKWRGRMYKEPGKEDYETMIRLFSKVPKIELVSNDLIVEVH